MKNNRSVNAFRNMVAGFAMKITQILLPFLTRTVMIHVLGMEYLGLSGLFASILDMLNMVELGVGRAMVFSMYKPIAENREDTLCALMRLYKVYYRIIGLVVAIGGMLILPFIPRLIKGDVPADVSVYALYLLNLAATVLSYWLFAYKNSILSAHQREDIVSRVKLIIVVVQNGVQMLLLFLTHNYYTFVITVLVMQVITNITTAVIANRMYPQYVAKGKLPKAEVQKINAQIKDLFTSKIGGVVFSAADSVVISAFLGLQILGIYQNYYYIVNAIIGFVQIIYSATTAGIGNSIITETKEKNYRDFSKLTFFIAWIAGFCSCCFICLFQPFMELWVGKKGLLPMGMVLLLGVFFWIWELYRLINVYKDAAGIWHEDRFRPLIAAGVNLGLNITLVNICGLYGVILSTVLSVLFVGWPWAMHNVFSNLFAKAYIIGYVAKLINYALVSTVAIAITYTICGLVKGNLFFIVAVRACICVAVTNGLFWLAYCRTAEYMEMKQLVQSLLKKRRR
ncbi:MAG: polysaccharide biosynthesis protein [Lachnospiraceae bacterium]|nr:polysaccharide biosynthesis protein [Lachnospiraceae bacterium]